jgi:ribosomal protein S27AE
VTVDSYDPAAAGPEERMAMLDDAGEAQVQKRCPFCGSGPLTMTWRPPADPPGTRLQPRPEPSGSSPLNEPAWWPLQKVLDARLRCSRCGNLSYGRLVAGHVTDDGYVDGHFVAPDASTRWETW